MEKINLPARALNDGISVSYALEKRVSCRNFDKKPLTLHQLSNILWSGQGVISSSNNMRRTAPSAGATYPLEIFVAIRKDGVDGAGKGIYQYIPEEHTLKPTVDKDVTEDLVEGCFNQDFLKNAGINMLISADCERTSQRYARRGERYVFMEAGAATQNISLEAVELGLGTVIIGAFDDAMIKDVFQLDKLSPLAVMPVGHPRDKSIYV